MLHKGKKGGCTIWMSNTSLGSYIVYTFKFSHTLLFSVLIWEKTKRGTMLFFYWRLSTCCAFEINRNRRKFRLPQRSHLRTLKNFVSEKSGKRCEKSGKHCIKSGNFEEVHLFLVSAPESEYWSVHSLTRTIWVIFWFSKCREVSLSFESKIFWKSSLSKVAFMHMKHFKNLF